MLQHLIDGYIELLKIENVSIRINLQTTYCFLRDTIANETSQSSQAVQEKYEEIALIESRGGMMECMDFKKWIGPVNVELITAWPPLAHNYWKSYKYAKFIER